MRNCRPSRCQRKLPIHPSQIQLRRGFAQVVGLPRTAIAQGQKFSSHQLHTEQHECWANSNGKMNEPIRECRRNTDRVGQAQRPGECGIRNKNPAQQQILEYDGAGFSCRRANHAVDEMSFR